MLNVREIECKLEAELVQISGVSKNRDSVVHGENNVLPSSGLCKTPTLQTEQAMASKPRQ